ncbi:YidH family protein [Nocardioides sp. Arc9.136]|uniref:YidH family protein n=1 Tax=Nocardioides sp. Arc9.136 TaxID=2996826 RepID=UPI002664EF6F|nr:DUF202 domain-containing protein [Nocardioides sp. Arc9.136]WKN48453.1 DUF202 domain-containing protein [Nocardioides sp. Arc9.136]
MDDPSRPGDTRWPRWVYGEGEDPDYRFSFANERTCLAWMRTSIALLAAGVALDVVDLRVGSGSSRWLAVVLVALAALSAVAAWVQWALAERALRRSRPLPAPNVTLLLAAGLACAAVGLLVTGL